MPKVNLVTVAVGAVLFILGLLIGNAMSGPSVADIEAAVGKRIDAASAKQSEETGKVAASVSDVAATVTESAGALGGKLDGLAAGVDAAADAAPKAVSGLGEKLGGDIQTLGQSLQSTVSDASKAQLTALTSGLAGLRGQIAEAPGAEAKGGAAEPAAAQADGAPVQGYGPGETALLSDGALRVFVSRIDAAANTASLRANGHDLELATGKSETITGGPAGDCKLTLDALDGSHVALSGVCGAALPPPDGTRPGTTVELAKGLRVFVSAVSDGGARIAVNGVQTVDVATGKSVEVKVGDQSCKVSVESVDRGRAALGYVCG